MGFIAAGDIDVYYEAQGAGPPILLIPPSGATTATWGELVDHLARVGRVITYDRRGYARTGGAPARMAAAHTRDAAVLLETLTARRAVVVGCSAGATIAVDLAVRRPDLVRAVVAHEAAWRALRHPDASGLVALVRMQALAWQKRYADAAEVLLRWVYSYRDGGTAWDSFPEQWRQIARDSGQSVVTDLRSTFGSYPHAGDLAHIRRPVLCTYGARSHGCMRAITESLAAAMPTATVHRIDGTAHAVSFDAPMNFTQVITDALTSAGEDDPRPVPAAQERPAAHRSVIR